MIAWDDNELEAWLQRLSDEDLCLVDGDELSSLLHELLESREVLRQTRGLLARKWEDFSDAVRRSYGTLESHFQDVSAGWVPGVGRRAVHGELEDSLRLARKALRYLGPGNRD